MFNPPIASGADLFIYIAIALISAGAAIVTVDIYKSPFLKKKEADEKE